MRTIPFYQWRMNYIMGKYNSPDRKTMIEAGWYDWFCEDRYLQPKLQKMAKIITQISDNKVNWQTMYVWFKNNCPINYPTYDDFRFADLETGDVIYTVHMPSEFTREVYGASYVVFGRDNNFKEPLFKCRTYKELVNWFNEGRWK